MLSEEYLKEIERHVVYEGRSLSATSMWELLCAIRKQMERTKALESTVSQIHSLASLDGEEFERERVKTGLVHLLDSICVVCIEAKELATPPF
jgi:hypothetical protein